MEIIVKFYKTNRQWLAGDVFDQEVYGTFVVAHWAAKEFLDKFPDGVVERHICEHTTIKIWRAGDDFGTV